jgi:ATPase family associated with various cellular activities (AAA)
MSSTITTRQEQDHFPPAVRQALHSAQQRALHMDAMEVAPEHLFLGVVAQHDEDVIETFRALRLDHKMILEQIAILFPADEDVLEGGEKNIALSTETHICLEWAISFAMHQQAPSLRLEHMLLGCVRHQRLQPLLALFLLNAGSILPFYMTERSTRAYTATMDQLIASRMRQRDLHPSSDDPATAILGSIERPSLAFSDIAGFHRVKQELQEALDFLKLPQLFQQERRSYLYGIFLVGPSSNNRTLIGKALAGEAAVPLLTLSLSALLKMVGMADETSMKTSHTARDASEPGHAGVRKGRHLLHDLFDRAKKASPCILWLDEVDLLGKADLKAVGEQWQSQLRIEMDGYNTHPAMVVIATISRRAQIDQLQLSASFNHVAIMDGTALSRFEAGLGMCASCRQEIPTNWKYCGFCGATAGKTCANCGTLSPDVKGVVYCPECGSDLEARRPA